MIDLVYTNTFWRLLFSLKLTSVLNSYHVKKTIENQETLDSGIFLVGDFNIAYPPHVKSIPGVAYFATITIYLWSFECI